MGEIKEVASKNERRTPQMTDEADENEQRIGICVGSERSNGLGALKWAIDTKFIPMQGHVRLLHVMRPAPSLHIRMGSKQSVDPVTEEKVLKFKEKRLETAMKHFEEYIELCKRNKITYELCYTENDSVRRELVIQISTLKITKLLLQKSPKPFLKRIVGSESISSYMRKNTPGFCSLVVIQNGVPMERIQSRRTLSPDLTLSRTSSDRTNVMSFSHELRPPIDGGVSLRRCFSRPNSPKAFISRTLSRGARDDCTDLNTGQVTSKTEQTTSLALSSPYLPPVIGTVHADSKLDAQRSHRIDLLQRNLNEAELAQRRPYRGNSGEITFPKDEEIVETATQKLAGDQRQRDAAECASSTSFLSVCCHQRELEELKAWEKILRKRLEEETNNRIAANEELERERRLRKIAEETALEMSKAASSGTRTDHNSWWQYSFEEIEKATDNFNAMNKLGQGTYGKVYKGILHHTTVAIKLLAKERNADLHEFQTKLELLSRLHHPHLVMLLGACPDKACLIYEYMANGSLEEQLYSQRGTPPLPWFIRFRIFLEVARALLFLHSCPQRIVHGHLKLRNVLLDRGYVSKITDIHVAELVHISSISNATTATETLFTPTSAYMDPHYLRTGIVTCDTDVYSLGILILQLLTKRPPLGIAFSVEEALERGQLHEMLDQSAGPWPLDEAMAVARLGLKCMEPKPKDRPTLETGVFTVLESIQKAAGSSETTAH
ncbi:hypothetical protein KP509_15G024700 [Ceratopteris richardii]|uniref:RING-type E3 ubiquitin transferase n=1 Tax=Ceratopteris richardii TaxID=49495 RepID=A0A8T2T5F1_CERRI|nr:hypothetical protein KP509_15G024700 [Ceratopteris richardii]